MVLVLSAAVWLQPYSQLAGLFCLVVLVAGAVLGPRAGFATAGVASAIVVGTWLGPLPAVDGGVALTSVALTVVGSVLGWLATNPVYVTLGWAWQSYADARQLAEELRHRQSELGRVVKSLNEAYLQLTALNDELVRARRAAEEARQLKAEFAANISHELRTFRRAWRSTVRSTAALGSLAGMTARRWIPRCSASGRMVSTTPGSTSLTGVPVV
ncbi:MAG: hypothetical protein HYY04_08605 [Chloroflexi bacterium]|nr:hypothetical protein [Chloroflexota bacterium]